MIWSYRVVETDAGFAVYEVYFNDAGEPVGVAEEPETRIVETSEELKGELETLLAAAIERSPMKMSDIPSDNASERDEGSAWVFVGASAQFPSGVFRGKGEAVDWIRKHRLTGTLTAYPVGKGVYEWAVEKGYFKPTDAKHSSPEFVATFSSASMEHYHFKDGEQ